MKEPGGELPRILIIGYGNTLRGDDGLGRYAARALSETIGGDGVRVLDAHQMTPDLAHPISESELTIFIDACMDGPPGTIRCETVAPEAGGMQAFLHHTSPSVMLTWAKELYGACPQAVALSVPGEDFGFREGLSPSVDKALSELLALCRSVVEEFRTKRRVPSYFPQKES